MSNLLLNKSFSEHHNYPNGEYIPEEQLAKVPVPIHFCNKKDAICVEIKENRTLHTGYYIGVDWIDNDTVIYIEPKINSEVSQTNYLEMLFAALRHPEVADFTHDLFEIKWNSKEIEIPQQHDLLTPLLVVQFLLVVKEIVRKGLKKSYYRVENNLYGRVKGKVLVAESVKKNLLKNKTLNTYCSYEEFGINGLENRLLKKALIFVQRFLPTYENLNSKEFTTDILSYIMPAFEMVSEGVNLNEIKHSKTNVFYKEYAEGIRLAKLILKRFGYNISNTQNTTIQTPPFWIDMSKLFELYVLGLLKDRYGCKVKYHFSTYGNELDFLLNSDEYQMVIDAKYKPKYDKKKDHEDIRQVSGYSRLNRVYNEFNKPLNQIIDCLIIYPDQVNGNINLKDVNFKNPDNQIEGYNSIYKVAVMLPTL